METLEEQVAGLTARLEQNDQRAIYAALRTELTAAGAIDDSVADVVLKHAAGSVKIDESGDVVGAKAAVEALKAKQPAWFGAAATSTQSTKAARTVVPTPVLPNLRGLSPHERTAALSEFRHGQRREMLAKAQEAATLPNLRTMSSRAERENAVRTYRRLLARADGR